MALYLPRSSDGVRRPRWPSATAGPALPPPGPTARLRLASALPRARRRSCGALALCLAIAGFATVPFARGQATAGVQPPAINPTPLSPAKAVGVHLETIYISPDPSSAVVGEVQPGQEVVILRLAHGYAQVFAGRSGWMRNQGFVLLSDPAAPAVLFGAADTLQQRAEQYSGEEKTAKNAARLYYQVYNQFPQSFRAAEALYRAAEITWQLDTAGLPPNSNNEDYQLPSTRLLREVVGKFPKTQWAARAEYLHLREQMTCGDWVTQPKCLGKEIGRLRGYWKRYPDGPLAAEAAFGILYRQAAAVHIYNRPGPHHDSGKARDYRRKAFNSIADLQRRWPRSDWAARAALISYDLRQHIAVGVHRETPAASPQ